MVDMRSGFQLPPVIRRFGRCGVWEQPTLSPSSSERGEPSESTEEIYENEHEYPSCYGGAQTKTDRVKSFVSGIVSPFTACWQPSEGPCAPLCAPDHIFQQQPAVVTPYFRGVRHRDREAEREHREYSRNASRRHKKYHPTGCLSKPFDEADTDGAIALESDKRKRNTDIAKPRSDDILCGRGGSSNRHLGNIHFRELVAANKQIYVGLTKKQKMSVARKIVDAIHNTGGRYLAKDLDTGLFYDIGLPRSLEKTSQALREKHSNEMPVQSSEDEGFEASVESHNSVIKNNMNTDKKGSSEDSPAEASSSSKSTTKSLKNTEAPSLIIPPHLMSKFGQKRSNANEEEWENNSQYALSTRAHRNLEPSYGGSYHSPSYNIPPPSSPTHNAYKTASGHPSTQPNHHHHRPPYPISPAPGTNQYQSNSHYYYYGHHHHTSPLIRRRHRFHEQYTYPGHSQEVYNSEYYSRSIDYEEAAPRRTSHGARPPPQFRRFQPRHLVSRQESHSIPRGSPNFASHRAPPLIPSNYGQHTSSSPMPTYRPSHHSPRSYYRYDREESPTSLIQAHDASPSSRILHKPTKNSHTRCKSEISPIRQKGLKRQRNGDAHTTRTPDAMLSTAVENSLSLDERIVGREREKQLKDQENSSTGDKNGSDLPNLTSPSTILQKKSSCRKDFLKSNGRGSPTEKKEDYSTLSGLAALSTAAFLKLDEDEAKNQT
eukprot:CAMPEP_0197189518 /NCGR_PEP_ID=MMETSP1423-20130617/19872_1 /TAXON_ID=476441 /ORGANISM="Pseudo-nitzschia heimii, Strain UNC1101" /LENGTH=713 /DNA_ID=CAMNT_0042641647 /DNA_START=1118 /DNA_END=3259 /DNA_ORIENTATION=-